MSCENRCGAKSSKSKWNNSLTTSQSGTNTVTRTSDDEDDASTPSGDNAERSLASTLGGSNENIPQPAASSFLQAALDGPGSLSDRGDRSKTINYDIIPIAIDLKNLLFFCYFSSPKHKLKAQQLGY